MDSNAGSVTVASPIGRGAQLRVDPSAPAITTTCCASTSSACFTRSGEIRVFGQSGDGYRLAVLTTDPKVIVDPVLYTFYLCTDVGSRFQLLVLAPVLHRDVTDARRDLVDAAITVDVEFEVAPVFLDLDVLAAVASSLLEGWLVGIVRRPSSRETSAAEERRAPRPWGRDVLVHGLRSSIQSMAETSAGINNSLRRRHSCIMRRSLDS